MKAAIIGYGKMGREIERVLLERGHRTALVIDADNAAELDAAHLSAVDVALEFTTPETARRNILACLESGTPVVSGTTGWTEHLAELQALCRERRGAFFYEIHHTQKKDAPSGTAITLAEGIMAGMPAKGGWVNHAPGIDRAAHRVESPAEAAPDRIVIESVREGSVVGVHSVAYESGDDIIELRHTLKNRRALALGAVVAAEFLCGKTGVYTMDDLLK